MKTKIEIGHFEKVLEDFERYLRTVPDRNGKIRSEGTIRIYLRVARSLAEYLRREGRKDFKDVDAEILKRFVMEYRGRKSRIAKGKRFVVVEAPVQWSARNSIIRSLSVFYRWLNNDEEPSYIKPLKKLVVRPPVEERTRIKKPSDILTPQEVLKMIKACDFENSPFTAKRDKAILAVLYESGCRIGELANTKIGDLTRTDYGFMLTLRGKTGVRSVPLVDSQVYLTEWLKIHPEPENPNAPLFVEAYKPNEPITTDSIYHLVRRMARRAKIQKKVFPHLFRHSRTTHLLRTLSEQVAKRYLGWSKSSSMLEVYSHISAKDIEDEMLRVYGIRPQQEPSIALHRKCHVCGKINSPENVVCDNCGCSLITSIKTIKALSEVEQLKREVEEIKQKTINTTIDMVIEALMKDEKVRETFVEVLLNSLSREELTAVLRAKEKGQYVSLA